MFENINFGDKYITRGGKTAIFLHKNPNNEYRFGTDIETFAVCSDGTYYGSDCNDVLDIVGKLKNTITKDDIRKILSLQHDTYLMHVSDVKDDVPEDMEQFKLAPEVFDDWVIDYIFNKLNN